MSASSFYFPIEGSFWFCVRSQPKHEHIAAARLRQISGVEVFCPRIRFKRPTRQGSAWVTEAMFPSYLFAHFEVHQMHRQVRFAPGVRDIVRFGGRFATVAPELIEQLREQTDGSEMIILPHNVAIGQDVQIVEGAFRGLNALVTQVLPAKERVKVLIEFLGRQVEAEINQPKVLPRMAHPLAA